MKLHYFPVIGRGEASRLILTLGKVPFEDVHVERDAWPQFKPKTPLGQIPVLELDDGRMLAQSGAIERYAAKLGGLYPEDPLTAAYADQAVFLVDDCVQLLTPTFSLPTLEERIKARQELLAGKLKDKLELLNKLLDGKSFVAGDKLSYADVGIYVYLSLWKSGAVDGFPTDVLESYPALKAFRNKIASLPAVTDYYAKAEGFRVAFKPDA